MRICWMPNIVLNQNQLHWLYLCVNECDFFLFRSLVVGRMTVVLSRGGKICDLTAKYKPKTTLSTSLTKRMCCENCYEQGELHCQAKWLISQWATERLELRAWHLAACDLWPRQGPTQTKRGEKYFAWRITWWGITKCCWYRELLCFHGLTIDFCPLLLLALYWSWNLVYPVFTQPHFPVLFVQQQSVISFKCLLCLFVQQTHYTREQMDQWRSYLQLCLVWYFFNNRSNLEILSRWRWLTAVYELSNRGQWAPYDSGCVCGSRDPGADW